MSAMILLLQPKPPDRRRLLLAASSSSSSHFSIWFLLLVAVTTCHLTAAAIRPPSSAKGGTLQKLPAPRKPVSVGHPVCLNAIKALAKLGSKNVSSKKIQQKNSVTVNVGVLVDMKRADECQRLAIIAEAANAANTFLAKTPPAQNRDDRKRPTLRFFVNDTNGLIGNTMTSLYAFFNNNEQRTSRPIDYILGPTRESIVKAVIEVAMFRKVPVISYAQTSPLVLSASSYSSLVRIGLTPPDYHWAVAKLVRSFGWSKVTLVIGSTNSTNDPTDLAVAHFEHIAKLQGISVASTIKIIFVNNSMLLQDEQFKLLNNIFHRVVVAFLDGSSAVELLCRLNRPFSALLWIFVGAFSTNWLHDEQSMKALARCPYSATRPAAVMSMIQSFVDYSFVIDTSRQHNGINANRLSNKLFRPPACRSLKRGRKMTREMRQAWDAVWLLAAVTAQEGHDNELIRMLEEGFRNRVSGQPNQRVYLIPRRYHGAGGDFMLSNVSTYDPYASSVGRPLLIDCLSGPLVLENGARRPVFRVYQIQNTTLYPVLVYHPLKDTLTSSRCEVCRPLQWRMGRPPKDAIIEHIERHTTPLWLTAIVFFATGCGAALAISFFVFTVINRKQRIIKLSAPALTGIFAIGSAMLYFLLPFLSHSASIYSMEWNAGDHFGRDEAGTESESMANVTCLIRYLLLFCGFTCTFCSVALRTYKIYIATTSIGRNALQKQFLRDERMLGVVGGVAALDVFLVVTWSQAVGFEFHAQNETQYYDAEMDHLITYQSVECSTPNSGLFFAVCCSWKLLLISFGLFLAWRIHGVKIKVLNDAKFIGAISYIIVISALVIGFIHVVGLSHSGVATYLLDVAIAVSANTLCLLLNFLPKVLAIYRGENAVLCSEGFVEQGGTRRFTSNVSQEHVSEKGVETQNTLLKTELTKLTARVEQMEGALERSLSKEGSILAESKVVLQSLSPPRPPPNKRVSLSAIPSPQPAFKEFRLSVYTRKRSSSCAKKAGLSVPIEQMQASSSEKHLEIEQISLKTLVAASSGASSAVSLLAGQPPAADLDEHVISNTTHRLLQPPEVAITAADDTPSPTDELTASKKSTTMTGQPSAARSTEQLERQFECLDAELRRALNFSLKSLAEI